MTLAIDINLAIQYSLVAVFVIGAMVWMTLRLFRKRKKSGCCGCALSDACLKSDAKRYRKTKRLFKKSLLNAEWWIFC